jgi:hypothetical protein
LVAEAGDDGIEAFPSGGEIDNRDEYGGVLVEEELHALQGSEYGVLEKLHASSRSGCLTREMNAATVRVRAVAEWCEPARWRGVHVAVRRLRSSAGARALSGSVIGIVALE